jgi:hypothetical protein
MKRFVLPLVLAGLASATTYHLFPKTDSIETPLAPTVEPTTPSESFGISAAKRIRIDQHLAEVRQKSIEPIEASLKPVRDCFLVAKQGVPEFAAFATGWGAKRRWLQDHGFWWTRSDRLEEHLKSKFEEHVLTADYLSQGIQAALETHRLQLAEADAELLRRVRKELSDLPELKLNQISQEELLKSFQDEVEKLIQSSKESSLAEIRREVSSVVGGELLAFASLEVLANVGISGTILGISSTSGVATLGIGLAAGLAIDQMLKLIWDFEGDLVTELNGQLDKMENDLIVGTSQRPGLRLALERVARERAEQRRVVLDRFLRTGW